MGCASGGRVAPRWPAVALVIAVALVASACIRQPASRATGSVSSLSAGATSRATPSTAQTGSKSPGSAAGDVCSRDPQHLWVRAPLPTYGDADTAELRFAGGAPPSARLCGSFETVGKRQQGSTASASGALPYLFSIVELYKVSTGGGYYWISGAVDNSVGSVVISFVESPDPVKMILVPLSAGWRGFTFEYSPGPTYYAATGPGDIASANAGLTVTAIDKLGKPLEARYVNLDTNKQRRVSAPSTTG